MTTAVSPPDSLQPRILIVKLSAVGDVVHTLPALNALREKFPWAHIGWVAHPGVANLLEGHPQINELIILPRRFGKMGGVAGISELLRKLRGKAPGWDFALDFQGLTKSGLVAKLSHARRRIGFGNEWGRDLNRFFMTERIRPLATPILKMNLGLLEPLGIVSPPVKAVLNCTADDRRKIRVWAQDVKALGERFLILDPFAGWPTKLWESKKWAEVARAANLRHGLRTIIFHGPGEKGEAEALAWAMRAQNCNALLAPETTLREYVALARMFGRAMIGADTGPMHIAAALSIPTIALFGPSDSRRNAPAFDNAIFETLQDFSQPCATRNSDTCRVHERGLCMSGVSAEMALEALARLLEKPAPAVIPLS